MNSNCDDALNPVPSSPGRYAASGRRPDEDAASPPLVVVGENILGGPSAPRTTSSSATPFTRLVPFPAPIVDANRTNASSPLKMPPLVPIVDVDADARVPARDDARRRRAHRDRPVEYNESRDERTARSNRALVDVAITEKTTHFGLARGRSVTRDATWMRAVG
tara:strand:+ start:20920 stop:21411 length:492 start_codon:yes stop_codon:yes gene_type:complete